MKRLRQIIAWAAIIILVSLYILAFIAAILSTPGHGDLFRFALGMTIAVPILAWIILYAIDHIHKN